jgi:membrane protein DedA with SNARE-associated domain
MDYLPEKEALTYWLINYGGFALFGLLALGIIALPVPEETLMVVAGILIDNGQLHIIPTFIAAYAGSVCGITVSYLLGKTAGHYFLEKYGSWVGMTPEKYQKVHNWFERYGKWSLLYGYFIPGVRHFTGFSAGMAELEYKHFAIFAYTGALIWVTTFLSIGYIFGNYWLKLFEEIEISSDRLIFSFLLIALSYLIIKYKIKIT